MKLTVLNILKVKTNLRVFRSPFWGDDTILTYPNAKEALKIIANEDPDLLITDQSKPVMNGFQLLKQLFDQSLQNQPSIIMLSRFEETNEIKEVSMLLKCITKPWNCEKLNSTIKSVTQF